MQDDLNCDWEPIRKSWHGAMPVGSDHARRAAMRKTRGSVRAAKKVAKQISGLHKRRKRRFE